MFSDQYRRPVDARPRREIGRPAWMEDYELPLQALQQPSPLPHQVAVLRYFNWLPVCEIRFFLIMLLIY